MVFQTVIVNHFVFLIPYRTPDSLIAKPITRLLVVKPLAPQQEDAIKAYKAIV